MILIELDYFFWLFFANFSNHFRVPPRKNTWISPIFRGPKRTSHQNLQIRFGFRSRTKFGGSTSCRLILVEGQGHNPRGWSWKGWVILWKHIQICSFHDFEHRRISRNKKKVFNSGGALCLNHSGLFFWLTLQGWGGAQELKILGIVWRHRIEKCA